MLSVTETETLAAYMKPPSRYGGGGGGAGGLDDGSGGPAKGFVVRDAPWNAAGNKVGPAVFQLTLTYNALVINKRKGLQLSESFNFFCIFSVHHLTQSTSLRLLLPGS